MAIKKELTYTSYLKVEELLKLQELQSKPEEHDEMLFIIIHQSYEIWFKQILFELDYLKKLIEADDIITAKKTMKRVLTILKVLVHKVDILETMTPTDFLSFRDYLESASGFQSYQFRELEFLLGHKRERILNMFSEGSEERKAVEKRYKEKSLWVIFLEYLKRKNYNIPEEILNKGISEPTEPNESIQKIFIEIYKSDSLTTQFCELLLDFDEGLQEWRYRHIKMVERTIGSKQGTGGSPGVEYLKKTLFTPAFPDLWLIRSELK
jgi:tryptophan 2,3-dioxygenase